ncbi:MAG: T9SS type A sorting domain-containing protein [Chitinophagales bacterium]
MIFCKSSFVFTIFLGLSNFIFAQDFFVQDYQIPVYNANAQALRFPFSGGFNNPQFSQADLDKDGIPEIFVFDRADGQVFVFENNSTPSTIQLNLVPELSNIFPKMQHWALLADYNCDGVCDIFTASSDDGITVFKGNFINNQLHFNETYPPLALASGEQIEIKPYSIPALSDIDNDGDLDILDYDSNGIFVNWFKNLQAEQNLPCENLTFDLENCWGQFSGAAVAVENTYILNSDCEEKNTAERHPGGSCMLAFDIDGDNDKDLFCGESGISSLSLLINGGSAENALMTAQDNHFPAYNVPFEMPYFAAPFAIDVNNDGFSDLLISTNNAENGSFINNCWYYQNNQDSPATFAWQQNDFLQNETIDYNKISHPLLFNYNNDSLPDLLIGSFRENEDNGTFKSLVLYENTGTLETPAFSFVSDDVIDLGLMFQTTALRPSVGDIDNDGDDDLIIGDVIGLLYWYENTTAPGENAQFSFKSLLWNGQSIGKNTTPFLVDINEDGLLDLIVGEKNGNLNYFQNTGDFQNPNFSLISEYWGAVDVRQDNALVGYSVPFLWKNKQNMWQLIVGSLSGKIFAYTQIENNLTQGSFTLQSDNWGNFDYLNYSSPFLKDLNNDQKYELLLGNQRGGLLFFTEQNVTATPAISSSENIAPKLYPNPAQNSVQIVMPTLSTTPVVVHIYNAQMQCIQYLESTQHTTLLNTQNWQNGVYWIEIIQENKKYIEKLLIFH